MTGRVNTYIAVFIITIFGSGAALLIVNIATSDSLSATVMSSEARYLNFQQQQNLRKR